jgi:restriction system protein
MANSWQEYQEEAAGFFRSLGLEATTDHTIQGVRTNHDVDVFVKSHHAGFDIVWIVECKHWKTKVTKVHVLALREIVADVGADRGILLAEAGHQSGAVEAATLTNVHVTSLSNLRSTASADIIALRLRELFDRVQICKERYWEIPKEKRIACGLRPDFGGGGYSGDHVSELANQILAKAFRGSYPFEIDSLQALAMLGAPRQFRTANEIVSLVEPMIAELEEKIATCEASH